MRRSSLRPGLLALMSAGLAANVLALPIVTTFDPGVPANARTAFQAAAALWEGVLPQSYVGEAANINVDFSPLGGLALAGTSTRYLVPTGLTPTNRNNPFRTNSFYPTALVEYMHGSDVGAATDFTIDFNQSRSWFYGTSGTPGAGQFDFITIAMHEIAHGLGFGSFIQADGSFFQYHPTVYDTFLACTPSCPSASASRLVDMTQAERQAAVTTGDAEWIGSFGQFGNQFEGHAGPLLIYTPPAFIDGSSVSHLDPLKYPDELMRPAFAPLESDHSLSAITVGMLEDIGWRHIPEPSTWMLLCVALLILARHTRLWRRGRSSRRLSIRMARGWA